MTTPAAGLFWYSYALGETMEDMARLNPWYAAWAAMYEAQTEIESGD